jgi:hypothetical protein
MYFKDLYNMWCKSFGVVKSKSKIAAETQKAQSYYFSVFSVPPWLIFYIKNQTFLQSPKGKLIELGSQYGEKDYSIALSSPSIAALFNRCALASVFPSENTLTFGSVPLALTRNQPSV